MSYDPRKYRSILRVAMCIWLIGTATLSTYLTHTKVKRELCSAAIMDCFPTVYLNSLLGLPGPFIGPDDSFDAANFCRQGPLYSELCCDFFHAAVERAKPFVQNPDHEYDIWLGGSRPSAGWPFVSRADSAIMFVDETKVQFPASKGPYPGLFDPSVTKAQFEQHRVEFDEFGGNPLRPWGLLGNWVASFLVSLCIWLVAARVIRFVYLRFYPTPHGFPVLVPVTSVQLPKNDPATKEHGTELPK